MSREDQIGALRREVTELKVAIKRNRWALWKAKAALAVLETDGSGIKVIVGGGRRESHGREAEGPRP